MGLSDENKHLKSGEWTPEAVACLLEIYGVKFAAGRGVLRTKDWEEVVATVNLKCESEKVGTCKTMKQCRDKVDSLKKRYKQEKKRATDAGITTVVTSWPYFAKLEEMMGSYLKHGRSAVGGSDSAFGGQGRGRDSEGLNFEDERDDLGHGYGQFFQDSAEKVKSKKQKGEDLDRMPEGTRIKKIGEDDTRYKRHLVTSRGNSGKGVTKKTKSRKPVRAQTLIDTAVASIPDFYAKIEAAKSEIFTKMKLEITKLENRRRRRAAFTSSSSGSK